MDLIAFFPTGRLKERKIIQDIFNAIALFLALINGNSSIEDRDISFFNMTKNSINLLKAESAINESGGDGRSGWVLPP